MTGMMAWGLEQPDALDERNDRAVLGASSMCPFVDLVGVDSQRHE
jgi:hypothetical protein